MRRIMHLLLPLFLTGNTASAQRTFPAQSVQATFSAGLSNTFTHSGRVTIWVNKQHGLTGLYFSEVVGDAEIFYPDRVNDAFLALALPYQYRITFSKRFDVTLGAGPAALIPRYEHSGLRVLAGLSTAHINYWLNKTGADWLGLGITAGCGYFWQPRAGRVYAEAGISIRLGNK